MYVLCIVLTEQFTFFKIDIIYLSALALDCFIFYI